MTTLDYYTPQELTQRFPQIKAFGWNASKIGIFFNSGLLIGYHCGKEKKALILESTLIDLIEFVNTVLAKRRIFSYPLNPGSEDVSLQYRTPEELVRLFPQIKLIGWNASKIGIFFSSLLLLGHHSGKEKKAFILESSFMELIEFANSITLKLQVFSFPKNQ